MVSKLVGWMIIYYINLTCYWFMPKVLRWFLEMYFVRAHTMLHERFLSSRSSRLSSYEILVAAQDSGSLLVLVFQKCFVLCTSCGPRMWLSSRCCWYWLFYFALKYIKSRPRILALFLFIYFISISCGPRMWLSSFSSSFLRLEILFYKLRPRMLALLLFKTNPKCYIDKLRPRILALFFLFGRQLLC